MTQAYEPHTSAPAPWTLTGRAFGVVGLKRPRGRLLPRVTVFCAVTYSHAPVGPYHEVFALDTPLPLVGVHSEVTHMYVDSPESTYWGRRNWAVPKRLARIVISTEPGTFDAVLYCPDEHSPAKNLPGFRMLLRRRPGRGRRRHGLRRKGRRLGIAVRIPRRLVRISQSDSGHRYTTELHGRGRVSIARLEALRSRAPVMPERHIFLPLMGFLVHEFQFVMEKPLKVRGV